MNVRLIAFRPATTSDSSDTQYELDLSEAPSIVANYNWIDIKEPEKKTGSFSQTIKLPFSERNNTFFENWFDVNLDDIVFNTDTKFTATIFVDTIEQLKGFIQLKAIYLNARQYEVVVFGNTADFFTAIKGKKLREAFTSMNGAADEQLDHLLTSQNVVNSWTTGLTTTGTNPVSGSSTSNDVMYPIIDYGHNQFPLGEGIFMDSEAFISQYGNVGNQDALDAAAAVGLISAAELKPSIRIQRLLQIIAQKAGYTITSTFLGINQDGTLTDTQFFSRLFMTLANQFERVKTYFDGFGFQVSMAGAVTQNVYGGSFTSGGADVDEWPIQVIQELGFTNESDPNFDPYNMFSINSETINGTTVQLNTIAIPTEAQAGGIGIPEGYDYVATGLYAEFNFDLPQTYTDSSTGTENLYSITVQLQVNVQEWGQSNNWGWGTVLENEWVVAGSGISSSDLEDLELSGSFQLTPVAPGNDYNFRLKFTGNTTWAGGNLVDELDYFSITVNSGMIKTTNTGLVGYTLGSYGQQVVMAENMPDLNQSDFVKDLMTRFNLVVLNDPNNDNNLIIEPYQDYINSGTTQYWTDKLDVSKEQVVKSTNDLQKKEYLFQDKKGAKDHMGERYEREREFVYGHFKKEGGEFASGDEKTFSIYSPFITTGIRKQGPEPYQYGSNSDFPVAICQWYQLNSTGDVGSETFRDKITDGIPRLFYYSGTPVDISGYWSTLTNSEINFEIYAPGVGGGGTLTNNTFPLCTAYNLDNLNTGIVAATKQLLWGQILPQFNFPWFVNNVFGSVITEHGYYNDYWSQFMNEIYNKEARIMECHLNLSPADIEKFESEAFKNPVYIKNTLWRVLKIQNYLVGGNKSTKVTLLKVIEKLNWDCDALPYTYNNDGTITFVDPADPTGGAVTINNACCEGINSDWSFQQTNDSTGVGTCYWNLNQDVTNPGLFSAMLDYPGMANNQAPVMLPLPAMGNTTLTAKNKQIIGQVSSAIFQAVTIGTATSYLGYQQSSGTLKLNQYTMAYLEVDLIGTITKGANTGAIGYFKYYTLLSRGMHSISHSGTSGGVQVRKIEGTNFPTTPTISLTNVDSTVGNLSMSITSSVANKTISWVAKVQVLSQKLVGADGSDVYQEMAIYQNGGGILFQNTDALIWN